jgi:hypothetical protein
MKIKTIIATALLSTTAFAADTLQKADIGFAFRSPTGEHAAGEYKLRIRQNPASAHMELRSSETGKTVMFYPMSPLQAKRGEQPRLVFKCGGANCDLAEIWTDHVGYAVRQRTPTPAEAERMAVVVPVKSGVSE